MYFFNGILCPDELRLMCDFISDLNPEASFKQPNYQIFIIPFPNKYLDLLVAVLITKINIPNENIIGVVYFNQK